MIDVFWFVVSFPVVVLFVVLIWVVILPVWFGFCGNILCSGFRFPHFLCCTSSSCGIIRVGLGFVVTLG